MSYWGRPMTPWRDYIPWLVWEHINVPPDELKEGARHSEVWAFLLRLLLQKTNVSLIFSPVPVPTHFDVLFRSLNTGLLIIQA